MRLLRGALLIVAIALVATFGQGFLKFAHSVETAAPPNPLPEADAIVALTGGTSERLTTAMRLLTEGRGRGLLVSGVNPRVPDDEVYALLSGPPALMECCVELGHQATDTLGNASETAAWASRKGFTRVIVVTDDYHMPRSLAELRLAMPAAQLIAYPVPTSARSWKRDPRKAAQLGGEYVKYLIIRAREAMLPRKAPAKAAAPTT